MKKIIILLAVSLAVTIVSGCGGTVPVKITNDLGAWDIEEVYIDPSDEPWSDNLISETLEPGEEITLTVVPGTYDIMIVDEDADEYTRWTLEIGTDGYDWAVNLDDLN